MARIICGYCGRNHPATLPCRPAEKDGFVREKLRNGEQRLPEKGEEIKQQSNENESQKSSEPEKIVNRSENNSQRQQYDPNAAERVSRWRENNREQYRQYQREYMRQRRAKLKNQ